MSLSRQSSQKFGSAAENRAARKQLVDASSSDFDFPESSALEEEIEDDSWILIPEFDKPFCRDSLEEDHVHLRIVVQEGDRVIFSPLRGGTFPIPRRPLTFKSYGLLFHVHESLVEACVVLPRRIQSIFFPSNDDLRWCCQGTYPLIRFWVATLQDLSDSYNGSNRITNYKTVRGFLAPNRHINRPVLRFNYESKWHKNIVAYVRITFKLIDFDGDEEFEQCFQWCDYYPDLVSDRIVDAYTTACRNGWKSQFALLRKFYPKGVRFFKDEDLSFRKVGKIVKKALLHGPRQLLALASTSSDRTLCEQVEETTPGISTAIAQRATCLQTTGRCSLIKFTCPKFKVENIYSVLNCDLTATHGNLRKRHISFASIERNQRFGCHGRR